MQMAATHNILNELSANEGANFSGKSRESEVRCLGSTRQDNVI